MPAALITTAASSNASDFPNLRLQSYLFLFIFRCLSACNWWCVNIYLVFVPLRRCCPLRSPAHYVAQYPPSCHRQQHARGKLGVVDRGIKPRTALSHEFAHQQQGHGRQRGHQQEVVGGRPPDVGVQQAVDGPLRAASRAFQARQRQERAPWEYGVRGRVEREIGRPGQCYGTCRECRCGYSCCFRHCLVCCLLPGMAAGSGLRGLPAHSPAMAKAHPLWRDGPLWLFLLWLCGACRALRRRAVAPTCRAVPTSASRRS